MTEATTAADGNVLARFVRRNSETNLPIYSLYEGPEATVKAQRQGGGEEASGRQCDGAGAGAGAKAAGVEGHGSVVGGGVEGEAQHDDGPDAERRDHDEQPLDDLLGRQRDARVDDPFERPGQQRRDGGWDGRPLL